MLHAWNKKITLIVKTHQTRCKTKGVYVKHLNKYKLVNYRLCKAF